MATCRGSGRTRPRGVFVGGTVSRRRRQSIDRAGVPQPRRHADPDRPSATPRCSPAGRSAAQIETTEQLLTLLRGEDRPLARMSVVGDFGQGPGQLPRTGPAQMDKAQEAAQDEELPSDPVWRVVASATLGVPPQILNPHLRPMRARGAKLPIEIVPRAALMKRSRRRLQSTVDEQEIEIVADPRIMDRHRPPPCESPAEF